MQLANRFENQTPVPESWVDRIFMRMGVMYGAKFFTQWENIPREDLRREWAIDLAGYSGEEISAGLEACKKRKFPPTLPEFLESCRPGLVPEIAFQEAVRGMIARNRGSVGVWSHPAIYWAADRVGHFDLMNNGYAVLKTRWENALTDILGKGKWEPIPDAHVQLPAPGVTAADRAEAAKRMQELGAAGVLKPKSRDHKAWAHRVVGRAKGKNTISPTVLAMARRALGEEVAA